ncbi:MAG: DUF6531 domain-containing protein, partial [Candidatus Sulfotelmatobacter sp.]
IATVSYLNRRLLQCEAYRKSLDIALSSENVQENLGNGIQVRWPTVGYLFPFQDSQFAEWSVELVGSRGRGHLYGVATQVSGVWDFSRLVFASAKGAGKLDLTPVRPLQLLSVPSKNVYLVPIGLAEGESILWAPAYYKSKLGIDLTLLPAIPLDPKLIDPQRNQLNSEQCIEFLAEKFPELARDPFSILIGVTSSDMYIPDFGWSYAENLRKEGHYAILSSARLHPPTLLGEANPEWASSRLEKLLTKNLLMLYFDLPMSSDYTSLLSGGVLSGAEVDQMGGEMIGAEGQWHSFVNSGAPAVTLYDGPGDKLLWRMEYVWSAFPDTAAQVFSVDADLGLMIQRKADFIFEDEPALQFTRIYRNQDDRSRAFGIGGSDSFEIFLGGQMGGAIDLIKEDGARIHFNHQPTKAGQSGDTYLVGWGGEGRYKNAQAIYSEGSWQVKTNDGWTYIFPFRPEALPQNVTVLTNFIDPTGREYKMERDQFGSLRSIESSSGRWLHFENDPQHRIRRITSSQGRNMQYEYDTGGRMVRATDSEGHVDTYTYDEKGQMITAGHGADKPILTNAYFNDGCIKNQVTGDGKRFEYAYFRGERNVIYESLITDPNGRETSIQYVRGGYLQSLPTIPHRGVE